MIKISRTENRSAPMIFCDICEKRIENAEMAAAVNNFNGGDMSDGDMLDVLHVHKGVCHDKADAILKDRGINVAGWVELQQHLSYLIHNVGWSPEAMFEFDRMLEKSSLDDLP